MNEQETKDFKPIEHRTDRDIVQSYIFTFARYELTLFEKRIIYNMIYDRQIQDYVRESIENRKNGKNAPFFPSLVGFKMPLDKITQNKGTYQEVKKAFVSLASKGFEYEDNNTWKFLNFIVLPKIQKGEGVVYFQVPFEVYKAITEISRGYRQFSLDIVLSLRSVYSQRFYEMFSRQDNSMHQTITKKIDDIKKLFKLENKYTVTKMFVQRVIEPAKKELDQKANYSFEYELQKSLGSRKYDIIIFKVYHIQENEIRNEELIENRTKAIISKEMKISNILFNGLLELGFYDDEIMKNFYLLFIIEQLYIKRYGKDKYLDVLFAKLDELKERALRQDRDNWKRYVIGTLGKIERVENDKDRALAIALKANKNF